MEDAYTLTSLRTTKRSILDHYQRVAQRAMHSPMGPLSYYDLVSCGVCSKIVGHLVFQIPTHHILQIPQVTTPPCCVMPLRPRQNHRTLSSRRISVDPIRRASASYTARCSSSLAFIAHRATQAPSDARGFSLVRNSITPAMMLLTPSIRSLPHTWHHPRSGLAFGRT